MHCPPVPICVRLNVPEEVVPDMTRMAINTAPNACIDLAALMKPETGHVLVSNAPTDEVILALPLAIGASYSLTECQDLYCF